MRLPIHPYFIKEAEERQGHVAVGQVAVQVLRFCEQPRKAGEIQELFGVKHCQIFRENYLNLLLHKGWLARAIPDKPQSRLQWCQTAQEEKDWLQTATTASASPPGSAS